MSTTPPNDHPPKRQPKRLTCGTIRFRRVQEWQRIASGISSGPFYVRVGVVEPGVVYLPELAYTHGDAAQCRHMTRVQTPTPVV